ncbi:MAG: DUF2480 family protein [Chitinophagales bacterium]
MPNKPLENKVAKKAIIQLDPQAFIYKDAMLVGFDLKPLLFKELLLKEEDFRTALKDFDFSIFQDKMTYIYCSSDAIIPMWAYMLVASHLENVSKSTIFAEDKAAAEQLFLIKHIENMDESPYKDKRIVIKGCGDRKLSPNVYTALIAKLQPIAKALMFGESCSMIPVFRKK